MDFFKWIQGGYNYQTEPGYDPNQDINVGQLLGNTAAVKQGQNGYVFDYNNPNSVLDYYNKLADNLREDMIRKEGYAREDTAYQRLVKDLSAAGINPVLALSSASPVVGDSGNSAYSSNSTKANSWTNKESANSALKVASIAGLLAAVLVKALL